MPSLRRAATVAVALVSAVSLAAVEPTPPPVVSAEEPSSEAVVAPEAPAAAPSEPPVVSAPAPKAAARDLPISAVTLSDGQVLRGRVVRESEEAITLELVSGGRMELARKTIREVKVEDRAMVSRTGEIWFKDPNRTRYFYSPSAMMLKQGEGYFSQKELFFSALAYGVTDNITVLVGSVLPAWLVGNIYGVNVIGAIKVGFSPGEQLHLATGFETIVVPGLSVGGGFLFGGITLGDHNAHVTLNAGAPFWFWSSSSDLGDAIITASANYRVGQNFAVVTENWFLPNFTGPTTGLTMVNSIGARIFGEQWAADLGFIRVAPVGMQSVGFIPIPWVDFTYNFG